ncbi:hypothetical protein COO60DRAFT_1516197 [Scenedesmus sp. NREL 46B-D3]|nr:hypothetical protein COO60DRAFT_1516197 [Scenedesmus sp. NREL 46B-D3]
MVLSCHSVSGLLVSGLLVEDLALACRPVTGTATVHGHVTRHRRMPAAQSRSLPKINAQLHRQTAQQLPRHPLLTGRAAVLGTASA